MTVKSYLGFDLGAESGRGVLGRLSNGQFTFEEIHRFPNRTLKYRDHLHWDVLDLFREMKEGMSMAAEACRSSLQSVSVDTWAADYVLLDEERRLLGYPYHYRDARTDGMMSQAEQVLSRPDLYEKTGNFFQPFNTLYQLLAESDCHPNRLEQADRLVMMPNFFLYLFSGTICSEYTVASTTQLADPWTRDWSDELIETFGFPKSLFPEVVEPGTELGTLVSNVQNETGLPADLPVVAGPTHDTAAAVAGIPALDTHWAFLSSGTWSLLGVERNNPLVTDAGRKYNFTNEGGIEGTVRFLKNIIGLWPLQECRRVWEERGLASDYGELTDRADEQGHVNAWIDLEDERFFEPGNMPGKIISFLRETGQGYQEDPGWITRCILESLALQYRRSLRNLEEVTGGRIDTIHMVGGGTRNRLLTQWTADATEKKVVAGPTEATAIGNIGQQAIADGAIRDRAELREIVDRSCETKTFDPRETAYWRRHESNYLELQS